MTPVDIARELVRIPSVNPDGDPGTTGTGEERCAGWIADFLERLGAHVSLRDVLPGRPNVVARFPSDRPGKPRLLFAPHTDTVSVLGMTIDPFSGDLRDDRLWGRGASDTKGPMAAMLHALAGCTAEIPNLSHEIWFAGLMGEEAGQHGAKALAAQEQFEFVIAGEPTSLGIVHAHKGSQWVRLRTTGRAVHASRPAEGENAIHKMLDALEAVRSTFLPTLDSLNDPVLGKPTASIGTISGGSKINIVPDECRAAIDLRTIPGQDIAHIERIVRERVPDITVESTGSPPLWTDPAHPLIRKLESVGAPLTHAPWFCDAAIFAAAGSSAVALGPGSIAQAHTADEFIAIDDLVRGAGFFASFLRSLRAAD